jgi:broad-specificity NMP kinase
MIGRARVVHSHTYAAFRKELYPQLIIVYGPSEVLITSLLKNYFNFISYRHLDAALTANQLLALPKGSNYLLTNFVPELAEVSILETYFHLKIVHLRHNRTELAEKEAWFDQEALLAPLLEKKPYYHAVSGYINDIIEQVGESLLPELLYANVHETEEREAVRKYVDANDGLLLNVFEIQNVLRRKPNKERAERDKVELLAEVLFQNLNRGEIVLTDYPWSPQEFSQFETHSRRFRLFADCVRADHYQFSKGLNAPIYFLETLRRKQIDLELPFESQVRSTTKYLLVTGAACAGKTSAAKFIAAEMGYRHIEYEAYLATVKEKLIAPEDGEELPFRKVVAHFASLVAASGSTPLLIDGPAIDAKEVENWTKAVGPAIVLNLKVDERELIRRTRKKAEGDLAAEVNEEELAKAKESLAKNAEWSDLFSNKSPLSTIFQIDFSQQLILAE